MAINLANNNSLANITALPASITGGAMTLISEQTASASATISFTSGIDSTYDSYVFKFYDIHPATNDADFQFNMSTDGGSNYNVTKTTTIVNAYHYENDSAADFVYDTGSDLAQSTSDQIIAGNQGVGNDNDQSVSGSLMLFNPSSTTTFVKHFMTSTNAYHHADITVNGFVAGYGNTTSAVNAVRFLFGSGNIDSGVIKLYGVL
jgi:hypothetical protein